MDVIRPGEHTHPEYVIILMFDNYNHLKRWQESSEYKEWTNTSRELIVGKVDIQKASGLELWFTLPDEERFLPKPAYYKMVIVSTAAVYPLVLLSSALLGPPLSRLPSWLGLFISIAIVSALMTYPVMPWLTHIFNFWLYPSSDRKHR